MSWQSELHKKKKKVAAWMQSDIMKEMQNKLGLKFQYAADTETGEIIASDLNELFSEIPISLTNKFNKNEKRKIETISKIEQIRKKFRRGK